MKKIITYGTYDLLHYGHIQLLKRAKALGDYLIVGVTADDFDKVRGKINVEQSLMERVEAIKATGLADEVIVEEYEGQKIDDIIKYGIDIFAIGSDWKGKFDYLNNYCKVIYLPRTEGISSSEVRSQKSELKLGLVGASHILTKIATEAEFVNGIKISGLYHHEATVPPEKLSALTVSNYKQLLEISDAIYLITPPRFHYSQIKEALNKHKHVICESPITLDPSQTEELLELAKKNGCILFDGIKTAYSTAYNRVLLLTQSGRIGKVLHIETTCTSLDLKYIESDYNPHNWNGFELWAPTALLPVFQLLGTKYKHNEIISHLFDPEHKRDSFTCINFTYPDAIASIKTGQGIKSEGDMVISGTNGYFYIPAPWWKTDYFELRREDQTLNKRYFYQLDGEGIRYELVAFKHAVQNQSLPRKISQEVSSAISEIFRQFNEGRITLI